MTVYISDHAVVQWLERVHGLARDVNAALPADASNGRRASYGCALLGITVREARDTICPERLHAGIMLGAKAVLADGGVRYPIREGVLVTCLTRDMRHGST